MQSMILMRRFALHMKARMKPTPEPPEMALAQELIIFPTVYALLLLLYQSILEYIP